jgi:predicted DNA-binding protein (MmcQ/YjbR family)
MVTQETYRKLALALPGVTEAPHFDKLSFRWKNKIFATLWEKENRAMVKLSLIDQSVFCAVDNAVIYPVPNAWGKQGATFVELANVGEDMFTDALNCAYTRLVDKNKPNQPLT